MSASQLDFIIEQGATLSQMFQVLNKDWTTGYSWRAKGRLNHGVSSTVFDTTDNATIAAVKDGAHTDVTITMSAASTAALTAPAYGVYDIEVQAVATGVVTRAFEGTFYITPEATK